MANFVPKSTSEKMGKMIKLSLPACTGKEREYIDEALSQDWIVPLGPHVDEFERRLATVIDAPNVVALSSGTAALHLGLLMLGVKPGDEVLCQSMTFAASAFPITYLGAKPVFVDSESLTWNMDPQALEVAIRERVRQTGRKPRAIVAVDLYGMPAQWEELREVARNHGIPLLEDAAEALGSSYDSEACGRFGRYGVLSFNGNKIITTSGGGALICPDAKSAERVKFYATQARENKPYYYHEFVGYNYRMSNISAAVGCAQIEDLENRVDRRRKIHDMYAEGLADVKGLEVHTEPSDRYRSNYWLTTVLLPMGLGCKSPEQVRSRMLESQIETRLLWRPMHIQPIFDDAPYYSGYEGDISATLFGRGLCLPSGCSLTDQEVERVIRELRGIYKV